MSTTVISYPHTKIFQGRSKMLATVTCCRNVQQQK